MRERDFMKKWVKQHIEKHLNDYWLRLPDTAAGTKPFDGVMICLSRPVAIEFKVWRKRKPYDFSNVEAHQMRELLLWQKAGGQARIVVHHKCDGETRIYKPRESMLRGLLKRNKAAD